eukprot:COSAG05_NODE_19_length_34900_cov_72.237464_31_plen_124_part_00
MSDKNVLRFISRDTVEKLCHVQNSVRPAVLRSRLAIGMHRRADRYRSIAIVKGYRTVKILWPTDECRKSSRLYKWENSSIFSHFWRNLLVASTTVLYEDLPFNTRHTVPRSDNGRGTMPLVAL